MSTEETPATADEMYEQFLVEMMRFDFSHHAPTEEGIKKIEKIRKAFKLLGEVIIENAPQVDERHLALTELKSTLHWAMAACTVGADRVERSEEITRQIDAIRRVEATEQFQSAVADLTNPEEGAPS